MTWEPKGTIDDASRSIPKGIIPNGTVFGRLTILSFVRSGGANKSRVYLCRCICGTELEVSRRSLRAGTRSCGCLQRDVTAEMGRIKTSGNHTHGFASSKRHPLYSVWSAMRQRCNNPKNRSYRHYGGRGIRVCDQWNSSDGFVVFLRDMGERPAGTSLDRIDNDGNYEPGNCRWATAKEQGVNRRRAVALTDEDIGNIRFLIEQGKTDVEIATIMGSYRRCGR